MHHQRGGNHFFHRRLCYGLVQLTGESAEQRDEIKNAPDNAVRAPQGHIRHGDNAGNDPRWPETTHLRTLRRRSPRRISGSSPCHPYAVLGRNLAIKIVVSI
jgi:hypothetical protein